MVIFTEENILTLNKNYDEKICSNVEILSEEIAKEKIQKEKFIINKNNNECWYKTESRNDYEIKTIIRKHYI